MEKEAFSLETGEISKVVQVGEHWVIMYCQGRTEPVVTDFDAVKDELHKNILEKKMRLAMSDKFYQLKEHAQIDNFLAGTSQTGKAAVQSARGDRHGFRSIVHSLHFDTHDLRAGSLVHGSPASLVTTNRELNDEALDHSHRPDPCV